MTDWPDWMNAEALQRYGVPMGQAYDAAGQLQLEPVDQSFWQKHPTEQLWRQRKTPVPNYGTIA